MLRSRSVLAATAIATAVAVAGPTTAADAAPTVSDPIVSGLVGPLQIDVGHHGQIYVTQSFAGLLTKVRRDGHARNLSRRAGAAVTSGGNNVTYTFVRGEGNNAVTLLKRRHANGTVHRIANLTRYEANHNPDQGRVYGFRDLDADCADQVPPRIGGEPYNGLVDSNPYALAKAPGPGWYVADAGGNDILRVRPNGNIRTVYVARPQPRTISAEAAEALGLPDCTIGETFAFEPVPTDVEVNRRGYLIVSLLPGGPEDATLGARGAVIRVSPGGEQARRLSGGFLGATNVALAPRGRIYVAELFANKISLLRRHEVTRVVRVPSPAGLEWARHKLYASTDVFGNGSIVKIHP